MFKPGQSGNPNGRRVGSRNKASIICDKIAEDASGDIVRAITERAKAGDADCARVILSRVWQARRGRPVKFELPDMKTPADLVNAIASISRQVADGALTVDEGAAICGMCELHRKAIETAQLEERIARLEAAAAR